MKLEAKKSRILIVEDEVKQLEALMNKFSREDFVVLEAKNGKVGLEIALREHPDLILLDVIMPVMDGMTMLKKLREDKWGKHIPVIILTNLTSADDARNRDVTELEPACYLVKSDWKLEDVVKKVKERLS